MQVCINKKLHYTSILKHSKSPVSFLAEGPQKQVSENHLGQMLPWVHFKILTPFESAKAFFQSWDFQNRRGSAILFLMHFICRQERITFLKARKLEKIITSLNRPQSHLLKIIGRVIYDSELSRDGRRITHFGAILFVSTSSMMS